LTRASLRVDVLDAVRMIGAARRGRRAEKRVVRRFLRRPHEGREDRARVMGAHAPPPRTRDTPSCATETTRAPSRVNTLPRASARPSAATGETWTYRSHSSIRNGRWDHIAWSRLACSTRGSIHARPRG